MEFKSKFKDWIVFYRGDKDKQNLKIFEKCQKITSSNIVKTTRPHYDVNFARAKYNHIYNFLEHE